jgi:cell division protein FtsX
MHNGLHRIFPIGDTYRDYFLGWFYSFGGIVNLSLSVMVFYTHAINNQQAIAANEFSFFFYLIPVLFIIWIIGLFAILTGKFKQIKK